MGVDRKKMKRSNSKGGGTGGREGQGQTKGKGTRPLKPWGKMAWLGGEWVAMWRKRSKKKARVPDFRAKRRHELEKGIGHSWVMCHRGDENTAARGRAGATGHGLRCENVLNDLAGKTSENKKAGAEHLMGDTEPGTR